MDLSQAAIHIEHLEFSYPNHQQKILSDINLSIQKNERFGLFGPNGAGKTTLMNCLTGLLSAKQGQIKLFGSDLKKDHKAIKKLIGLVPQDFAFYHELSPSENLEFFGALSGVQKNDLKKKIKDIISILEIDDTKQLRHLSGGMKRRVNLAIGVIHEPLILFLDEPTVGVDVRSRRAILSYLKEINEKGTTLVYTSHQLNEAEELCDRIALLHEGKIIAHDTLPELLSQHDKKDLEELFISLTGKNYKSLDE